MISIEYCNNWPSTQFAFKENKDLCVDNILTILCKKLKIRPLCQPIFGLKKIMVKKQEEKYCSGLWLNLSKKLSDLNPDDSFQFRIRFLPPSSDVLKRLDPESYSYLFYQVRHDFLSGNLPEHIQQPKDGLGLVVTDIVHHLLEHPDKKVGDVDISSFMPKSLKSFPNRHNVKNTTENLFKTNSEDYRRCGPEYIRSQYLGQVEEIARPGGYEKYSIWLEEGNDNWQVDLFIDPFHPSHRGLYFHTTRKGISHICSIEQLVFVSVRMQDLTMELSRENGIPCYLRLQSKDCLESLVSCLSGYYRLMKTWTFDLCREFTTPSLAYLRSNKCHGPVGKDFTLRKLKMKGREAGVGLLRASSLEYNSYKLCILNKNDEEPHELQIFESDVKVYFKDSPEEVQPTLESLIRWAIRTNFKEYGLKRLLPPSDLDNTPQLLIYASTKQQESSSINSGPRVMQMEQFLVKNKLPLRGKFSDVYHVDWSGESNEELAIKVPKLSRAEREEFLKPLSKFLFIEGDCVVKMYGVTLDPLALVMEYLPLGPLNIYLRNNAKHVRQVDLVEAASYLAKALWDLHSKNVCHYNIRCHNVFVVEHTDQRFKVKLGDPGKVEYTMKDIHWLPREHLLHPPSALSDPHADTWAFATTLWEIFSLGESPLAGADIEEVKALYAKGFMLSKPELCPKDLYQVMFRCWHPDSHSRKHPQSIMRDIKQIFYNIFNSRRVNPYEKVLPPYTIIKHDCDQDDENDDASVLFEDENLSVSTQVTTLTHTDGSHSEFTFERIMNYPLIPLELVPPEPEEPYPLSSPTPPKSKTLRDILVPPTWGLQSMVDRPPSSIQFDNCSIEILSQIGKGNYGYVFKGLRTFKDKRSEYVALKRLKSVGSTNDFKKEMEIMKNLCHENVVHFHCLVESDQEGTNFQYMVMEYLCLGSLQDYLLTNKHDHRLTSDKKLLSFSLDIAKGMDYLESQKIIHRDLAARNVLVASEDHVKITDFGLAQRPNQGNYYILRTVREMPLRWYALESIERGKFSHKTDVWSYGVTLWEMFTRGLSPDLPNDGTQLIQTLQNGTRLICKAPCKPFIYSKLIRPCWDEDPGMRPDFTKIISVASELQEELW